MPNAIAPNAYRPGDVIATRKGIHVEIDNTDKIFSNPSEKATEDYISGRFG